MNTNVGTEAITKSDIKNVEKALLSYNSNPYFEKYKKAELEQYTEFTSKKDIVLSKCFTLPKENPQIPFDYSNDILLNLIEEENQAFANQTNYFVFQKDINEDMRFILYEWLFRLQIKYKFQCDTIHIAFNLIERFLMSTTTFILKSQYQILGLSCLLIACKYQEIYFPNVVDFVNMTDNSVTIEELLFFEMTVLTELKYQVTMPLLTTLIELLSLKIKFSDNMLKKALFLADVVVLDYEIVNKNNLVDIAFAICFLVLHKYQKDSITKLVKFYESIIIKDLIGDEDEVANQSKIIYYKLEYLMEKIYFFNLQNNGYNCNNKLMVLYQNKYGANSEYIFY